jgi:hypothetical protein
MTDVTKDKPVIWPERVKISAIAAIFLIAIMTYGDWSYGGGHPALVRAGAWAVTGLAIVALAAWFVELRRKSASSDGTDS